MGEVVEEATREVEVLGLNPVFFKVSPLSCFGIVVLDKNLSCAQLLCI